MSLLSSQDLIECIKNTKKPTMGICLGMQIMFERSAEGDVNCIGIFKNKIIKLPNNIRIPQMGWNKLLYASEASVVSLSFMERLGEVGKVDSKTEDQKKINKFVYFANSYYAPIGDYTINYVDYEGIKISAMVQKDNFFGCQFHPEKSGKVGEEILDSFIKDNR